MYNIQRRQLPLHPGALSSAHKAQGETLPNVLIDMRDAPGPTADPAIGYVALSRATGLDGLKLLFPVTKDQLNVPPDKDCIALMTWMAKKADHTAVRYVERHNHSSNDTRQVVPLTLAYGKDDVDQDSTSDDCLHDSDEDDGDQDWRTTTNVRGDDSSEYVSDGDGDGDVLTDMPQDNEVNDDTESRDDASNICDDNNMWLAPNENNNCFFNAALAMLIALWWNDDDHPLQDLMTHRGRDMVHCVDIAKQSMRVGPLQDWVLVSVLSICYMISSYYCWIDCNVQKANFCPPLFQHLSFNRMNFVSPAVFFFRGPRRRWEILELSSKRSYVIRSTRCSQSIPCMQLVQLTGIEQLVRTTVGVLRHPIWHDIVPNKFGRYRVVLVHIHCKRR